MKIRIEDNFKKYITLADMDAVRKIRQYLKDDEYLEEYARSVASAVTLGYVQEVYKVTASICKNCRIHDYYDEGTGDFDVWIEAAVLTDRGFVLVGANLSDIWSLSGRELEDVNIVKHMFRRVFREAN